MKEKRVVRDFSDPLCQPFFLPGGKHGVLLLHGFTGSIAHLRLIGEGLQAKGFTVMGINLPGHATSMEDMAEHTWQDWLGAAKQAFVELKEKCEYVSVAGLSMGGCLTLLLAEQMPVTACAPISAPTVVKNKLLPFAGVAWRFMPIIMWGKSAEREAKLNMRYDIGYPGFYSKCGAHLYKLMVMARRNLHAIRCPILVVQSRADETIEQRSAKDIIKGVSSERKGVLWLEDSPHVCTISADQERITEEIAKLFREAE